MNNKGYFYTYDSCAKHKFFVFFLRTSYETAQFSGYMDKPQTGGVECILIQTNHLF